MSSKNLEQGMLLLLKMKCRVLLSMLRGTDATELEGEVLVRVESASYPVVNLTLIRLGLYGPGLGETGWISMGSRTGQGTIAGTFLSLSFIAWVTYGSLERSQLEGTVSIESFQPKRETFEGELRISFEEPLSHAGSLNPARLDTLYLRIRDSIFGHIRKVESTPPEGIMLLRALQFIHGETCAPEFQTVARRLRIQLVQFDLGGGQRTGQGWNAQRDAAIRIWKKCCLEIQEQMPPLLLPMNDAVRQVRLRDIALSVEGDPGVIYVFFIPGSIVGGGWTMPLGAAHARIVLSDQISGNTNVLAHEMGHALGGDDAGPGKPDDTYTWVGDPCTILQSNDSLTQPNIERNTFHNCDNAVQNDALESLGICCMHPDDPLYNC